MSYQVLALKWRPKTFAQVKGQTALLNSLQNNLQQEILHNCYLFTGTRGVGKTTLARILAKAMNCEQGISHNPCLTCSTCQSIEAGRCPDVIEVDAASKTKVDDTRELLENIIYAPVSSRFKIYIIDEVHMLSTHSFNALLKTIEEPPAHVKFILATTEVKKIPNTIVSRCTKYHLKEFNTQEINEQLAKILSHEQITADPSALEYIAELAHGSMRDALTLCEQVIEHNEHLLTMETCQAMFGIKLEDKILKLMELVIAQDKSQTLAYLAELLMENFDLLYALKKMQSLLFSISLLQVEASAQISWPQERVQALAASATARDLQVCYQAVVNGARDLAFVPDQKIGFQMIILRMLSFQAPKTTNPNTPSAFKPQSMPSPVTTSQTLTAPQDPITKAVVAEPAPIISEIKAADTASTPSIVQPVTSMEPSINWEQIISRLELKGLAKVIAENCVLESFTNNICTLQLESNYKPLLTDKIIASIAQGLSLHYNQAIEVKVSIQKLTAESPAMRKKQLNEEAQNTLKQGLINNTNVIGLQQILNAKLERIQLVEES
jgi:DNA polymerase-3 subunit gamma/tau